MTEEQIKRIREEQEKYPNPKTSIIHALFIVQEEKNYITEEDVKELGKVMGIDPAEIWSVASFYTMIYQEPVGEHVIQVCDNLSCLVEGAGEIVDYFKRRLNVEVGETTPDGKFTLLTVECLGSCGSAPMCQVNDGPYHENLEESDVDQLIEKLRE